MKRILLFILMLSLAFSTCISASAVDITTSLEEKFYNYCAEVLSEDMKPDKDDKVIIDTYIKKDNVTIFFGYPNWIERKWANLSEDFGICRIESYFAFYPYDLGIYVNIEDDIYTLREAFSADYVTEDEVLSLYNVFSGEFIFSKKHLSLPENKYEEKVFEALDIRDVLGEGATEYTYYEIYEYYSHNTVTDDEATPDYVLIELYANLWTEMPVARVFGDYVLFDMAGGYPFTFGYGIYLPKTEEVLSLTKAYELDIEGIDKVFTEAKVGRLVGDTDRDRQLTIKDATEIQKSLAGLTEEFAKIDAFLYTDNPPLISIADFDRDCEVTIKDATAIQKYVAGLEY